MADIQALLNPIRDLHNLIRNAVVDATEHAALGDLTRVDREAESDTIYKVDRVSEDLLVDFLERKIAHNVPIVLIAEGLAEGQVMLPRGTPESEAVWRIIVDPIDGTRGLMYQKRSAWILTGVAPNHGPKTNLQDIELAVQTEVPLVKQHLTDTVWAIRGQGFQAERLNRLTGERRPLHLNPSTANTIAHGFVTIGRYFPGAGEELVAIDEEIVRDALGPVQRGRAHCFEDQYISSGGQLYELMAGHDRFVADLRPLVEPLLAKRGLSLGLCAHSYDVCTELIARQLGVVVTDARGNPLRAPLDITTEIDWVGYANSAIRFQMEPLLQKVLQKLGLNEMK